MSDLISRTRLYNKISDMRGELSWGDMAIIDRVLELIENAPDAAVHGSYDTKGYCSVCDTPMPTDNREDYISEREVHYCYYCGARMEGTKY